MVAAVVSSALIPIRPGSERSTLGARTRYRLILGVNCGETGETVVRRADACLYGAKRNGRNLVINQNDARMSALETSAA